ncbi:PP2C family protein-serine/threonine phosphatase [Rubrivivax rivuli]|jgi:serine/threonine protein phosphatase PrpC|uniref:Serine/threonine-protein phosphatase n=1 Tax=Rubrivivax rivuli TaxID=1862385 RepID=A0A437RE16_9BURK|nr:protein phosphatase 2C domain-containing protein [Rubrivivax rivuli]RVU44981.1 serine/threonine-protein phosphatase [Rubrivivax rivuli]
MLALEVALLSDRGGRKYNEDACGHWHSGRHLCCVLADGAGGHGGGDIASRLAVQELIARFSQQPSERAAELERLLRVTNDVLISERVPGTAKQDMHSTVVCLVIDFVQHTAHWAHSGDSRMYWFRQGRVLDRTRDHSLVQGLVDSGVLTLEQIRSHPKRSELRSALGLAPEMLEVSAREAAQEVQAGDVFLLCTDGLWEYLDDEVLESTLAAAPNPGAWIGELATAVRAAAAHKTSHDNFSALTVWTRAAPAA